MTGIRPLTIPPRKAILERLGHEPATLTEFEAVYGKVKRPDNDG